MKLISGFDTGVWFGGNEFLMSGPPSARGILEIALSLVPSVWDFFF